MTESEIAATRPDAMGLGNCGEVTVCVEVTSGYGVGQMLRCGDTCGSVTRMCGGTTIQQIKRRGHWAGKRWVQRESVCMCIIHGKVKSEGMGKRTVGG